MSLKSLVREATLTPWRPSVVVAVGMALIGALGCGSPGLRKYFQDRDASAGSAGAGTAGTAGSGGEAGSAGAGGSGGAGMDASLDAGDAKADVRPDGPRESDPPDAGCFATCAAAGKSCGFISDGCNSILDCGSCMPPQTCGGGGVENVCGCVKTTCAAEGKNCGTIDDKCGGTLDCGMCSGMNVCGGGNVANVCGCGRQTCAALGAQCGAIDDGCGGTINCGSCMPPKMCGAGGQANSCGCKIASCADQRKNCGTIPDGCGGVIDCGSCTVAGETCGGGGPNVCGAGPCNPTTCAAQNKNCGVISDGCGATLTCGTGTCTLPQTCGGGGTANVCGCTATTCMAEGKNCGSISNGCGSMLTCGMCSGTETCGGGGTANVCGCTPTTCAAQGKNCDTISDGCGGTLTCGTCMMPQTCAGGGTANVCGCTPTTCAAQGKNCGTIADGCGGTLSCGMCGSPDTCGGAGTPNVCGCTPTSCAAEGKNCGSISNGCSATLNCGMCTMPETCGGGGNPNVCGCTPTTCALQGKNCGTISNGCGGTLDCGTCMMPKFCSSNVCVDATCNDGTRNGSETDIDCGGPTCAKCANGKMCGGPSDCVSNNCVGGVCRPPPEVCNNGIDDDQDTLTDCADPDCGSYGCTPAAPMGWFGPVELFDGDISTFAACGGPYPTAVVSGNGSLSCTDATCSACRCDPPTGVSCDMPSIAYYASKGGCLGLPSKSFTASTGCTPLPFNLGLAVGQSTASGGSCARSGGSPSTSPVTWGTKLLACEGTLVEGGCGSGRVCAPKPPPPFGGLCVYASGDLACPSEYPNKHVSYGTHTDTRGCTACTCGTPSGVTCNGSVNFWADSTCPTLGKAMIGDMPSPCTDYGPYNAAASVSKAGYPRYVTGTGSCSPGGGAPTGACTPSTPTTVCCQ